MKQLLKIAAEWHSGQNSPLYAFASTEMIVDGLVHEIMECVNKATGKEQERLQRLLLYVIGEKVNRILRIEKAIKLKKEQIKRLIAYVHADINNNSSSYDDYDIDDMIYNRIDLMVL